MLIQLNIYLLQSKINIQCLSNTSKNSQVVTLSWYDGKHGHVAPDAPTLVICYDNGRMQIMKQESDDSKSLFLKWFIPYEVYKAPGDIIET